MASDNIVVNSSLLISISCLVIVVAKRLFDAYIEKKRANEVKYNQLRQNVLRSNADGIGRQEEKATTSNDFEKSDLSSCLQNIKNVSTPGHGTSRIVNYINDCKFPERAMRKIAEKYGFDENQMKLVSDGLKEFFIINFFSRGITVAMPSVVVNDLWQEFILHTTMYRGFCDFCFGRYLDSMPSDDGTLKNSDHTLKRAWNTSCEMSGNTSRSANKASNLFTVDYQLGVTSSNNIIASLSAMGLIDSYLDSSQTIQSQATMSGGIDISGNCNRGGEVGSSTSGDSAGYSGGCSTSSTSSPASFD